MIEKLQLVFIIKNKGIIGELDIAHTFKYIGAIIKLLQWHQWKYINLVHGMIKDKL